MSNDSWKYNEYEPGTITAHAQKFGRLVEEYGMNLSADEGKKIVRWPDLVQAFADCAQDAVDAHVRQQKAKAAYLADGEEDDASPKDFPLESSYHWASRLRTRINQGPLSLESIADEFRAAMAVAVDEYVRDHVGHADEGMTSDAASDSPEEQSETPDRISAQSIIVHFMNGADEIIHCHHPMVQNGGWTFRELNGIPYLVIGHAIPRRQYPLCNIRFIELSPELL
jgi:hypothetical protein